MPKLDLTNVTSGFVSTTLINANNALIETAMEKTLSRDGTSPNQMDAPLDMNGNLIINQANPITVDGFNWEGPWTTGLVYQVGDVIENASSSYICIVEHTAGVFATDLAAGKWQLVASSANLPTQSGHNGDILSTDGTTASWVDVNTLALPITGGTVTGSTTFSSNLTANGIVNLAAARLAGNIPIVFEGATTNAFDTSIVVTDPTVDRTVTLPDANVDLTNVRQATTTLTGYSRFATDLETLSTSPSSNLAVSPAGLASVKSYLATGYQRLPGGLVIQWGVSSILNQNASETLLYPIGFTTAVLAVFASPIVAAGTGNQQSAGAVSLSTTQISVINTGGTGGITFAIQWLAIGY